MLGICPNTIRTGGIDEKLTEHRRPINGNRMHTRDEKDS